MLKDHRPSISIFYIGYDKEKMIMEIEFRDSVVKGYNQVPVEIYEGYCNSKTLLERENYYINNIKGKFYERQIN